MSDENKQVAKTFAETTAAGIPAHLVGAAIGENLGNRYLRDRTIKLPKIKSLHFKGSNVGQFLGTAALGGIADIVAMKHSLSGNVKKEL